METRVYTEENDIPVAAASLRLGGLVAVPTETVYGLCANGLDAGAVAHLYEVKGRPEVKPLSLMVGGPGGDRKVRGTYPPGGVYSRRALLARPAHARAGGEKGRCPLHRARGQGHRRAALPGAPAHALAA